MNTFSFPNPTIIISHYFSRACASHQYYAGDKDRMLGVIIMRGCLVELIGNEMGKFVQAVLSYLNKQDVFTRFSPCLYYTSWKEVVLEKNGRISLTARGTNAKDHKNNTK